MSTGFDSAVFENLALWNASLWDNLEINRMRAQLMLHSLPEKVRTVLDVGCGNGVFTNLHPKIVFPTVAAST